MKGSTKAIIALSAALALCIAAGIYLKVSGNKALTKTKELLDAATIRADDIGKSNTVLKIQIAGLESSKDLQQQELRKRDAIIAGQSVTIGGLKAEIEKGKDIEGVAINAGADLKEAYEAGQPIIERAAIPALTAWYGALATPLEFLLLTDKERAAQIAGLLPYVVSLEESNRALKESNDRQATQLIVDSKTIGGLTATVDAQAVDIDGLKVGLGQAETELDRALRRIGQARFFAVIFGVITIVETGLIVGHSVFNWW